MKYMGIDFGTERLGIAVSDGSGMIAFPKGEIANDAQMMAELQKTIGDERIEKVIIGDTRALNGQENVITPEADAFAKKLEESGIAVDRIWEAWSTFEAARFAPSTDKHNDAAAAAVILQRYLDMHAG